MRSLPAGVARRKPVERRLGSQPSGEFGALARAELVGAGDLCLQAAEDLFADRGVAAGAVGVVADDEPVAGGAVVDADLLDAQVARDGVVAALAGQRRGGLV